MDDFETPPQDRSSDASAASQLLPLYLLLLAFFILLVSLSSSHSVRSKAVMDSLTSTFSAMMPAAPAGDPAAQDGGLALARSFQSEVGAVFSAQIPAAKVKVLKPGRLMEASFLADELFFPGTAELRPGQGPLLDRLAAALAAHPAGLRYEMDFILGVRGGEAMPVAEGLQAARAGALARAMQQHGAPPGSLMVGLAKGDPDRARMEFRVDGTPEDRDDFGRRIQ